MTRPRPILPARALTRVKAPSMAVLTVVAMSMLGACSDSQDAVAPATTTESTSADSYLFVFEGGDATLTPAGDGSRTLDFIMPIHSQHAPVTWFTDRPTRDAGHTSMEAFVALWSDTGENSFHSDPPNVAIAVDGVTIIATMTDPQIRVGEDGSGQALHATMTVIPPAAASSLAEGGGHLAGHAGRSLDQDTLTLIEADFVSVFVDDAAGRAAGNAAIVDGTGTLVAGGVAAGAAIDGALEIGGLDTSSSQP